MVEKETKAVRFIVVFAVILLVIFSLVFLWMKVNGVVIEFPTRNETKPISSSSTSLLFLRFLHDVFPTFELRVHLSTLSF
jgi:hypothetical protein